MASPKDFIYPDGDDCSKRLYCMRIELGKVVCWKMGEIDPDGNYPPTWSTGGCPLYKVRKEFEGVSE